MVAVRYSRATSPLQLSYSDRGMRCEFTLMTIGGGSATSAPNTRNTSALNRPTKQPSIDRRSRAQDSAAMPPPSQPTVNNITQPHTSQRSIRPSPPPPRASIDHESLFVSNDDQQEQQWEERNFEAEEDEMGWDASIDNVSRNVFNTLEDSTYVNPRTLLRLDFGGRLVGMRVSQGKTLPLMPCITMKTMIGGLRQPNGFRR